jgi:hypothetical protein
MLEYPERIPRYSPQGSDNPLGDPDNQQGRPVDQTGTLNDYTPGPLWGEDIV